MSNQNTISRMESEQLAREEDYENIIHYLRKALLFCKSNTIQEAIVELSNKSRFKGKGY